MAKTNEEPLEAEVSREVLDVVPRVMRQIRVQMREMAKPELTIPQMRTLARISRDPGTVSELAEWLGVTAPAMSKMIGILERRGLIQRTSLTEDRRQVRLSVTEDGRKHYLSMRKGVRLAIAEKLQSLPDEKKQILLEAMKILGEIYA